MVSGLLSVAAGPAARRSPWATTRVDGVVSVEMPYAGTMEQDSSAAEVHLRRYATTTSDNSFEALRLEYGSGTFTDTPGQNGWVALNIDKFLKRYLAIPEHHFSNARLTASFPVSVPTAPDGTGFHRLYRGFDERRQEPVLLELTWVARGNVVYIFSCANLLPEEAGAREDKQRFFTTIHFQPTP